jgi:hypothetical protein
MMRYTSEVKILVLLAMIICSLAEVAAQTKSDTVKTDTVRNKYIPTGIRIGTDIISLVKTRTQENFNGWEVNGDIDFNRYYFALEYGTWGRNFRSLTSTYANTGKFWRAGIDVNFLTKDPDRNLFFIGVRYGRSVFTESMSVTLEDPNWGLLSDSFYQSDVNAWWIELTSGLKVKVWKIFWIGYTGRFKFALTTDATEEMLPFDIPGFGRADKETTWGFNYYLMIRIPIRKAPPPPVEKK